MSEEYFAEAGPSVAIPVKRSQLNWITMFTAYCNGAPLEDIAAIYDAPLEMLQQRATKENWKANRLSLALVNNADTALTATDKHGRSALDLTPEDVKTRAAEVITNRKKHLHLASLLYDDALEVITKLRDGTLKLEKQFHNKGFIVRAEVDPTMADRIQIANYVQTIANVSYRALGDLASTDKASDPGATGQVQAPAITIILPMAVAQPREERELKDAATPAPVVEAH